MWQATRAGGASAVRDSQDLLGKSAAMSEGFPANSADAPSKLGSKSEVRCCLKVVRMGDNRLIGLVILEAMEMRAE